MRFAHLSDVHLGSWSAHPDMKELSVKAFEMAMDECIKEKVDFIIIAGDLFDTSLPSIDVLKACAAKFREVVDSCIRIYVVPGSHDFSPTGKTMLGVFENAGLLKDVAKYRLENGSVKIDFTIDKTGAKIAGMLGKMGALERAYYEKLDRSIEDESGFKIFVLHSALEEYRPPHLRNVDAIPMSYLPKNFSYYANGHVHIRLVEKVGNSIVAFPGPLFPTSFDELEKYDSAFYTVDVENNGINVRKKSVKICDVVFLKFNADGKSTTEVEEEIIKNIEENDVRKKILLLKVFGTLEAGKPSDIDFKKIFSLASEKGASIIKKSVSGLTAKEFKEIEIKDAIPVENFEKDLIKKHAEEMKISKIQGNEKFIIELMDILNEDKIEGETNPVFEERIKSNAKKLLELVD